MAACSLGAADFLTGQGARLIVGQPTFTAQRPDSTAAILGGAGGVAYANDLLVVADANRVGATPINHRVLIYRNVSQWLPGPTAELPQGTRCPACIGVADVTLGTQDTSTGTLTFPLGLTQTAFRLPTAVATDGTHIVVADTDNNRVLIWNTMPAADGAPASVVVGQPDFTSGCPNATGPPVNGACTNDVNVPSAKGLRSPQGVWLQNGKLLVADNLNHRVLIWNSIPTSNFAPADLVLGEPNFGTTHPGDLTKAPLDPKPNNMLNPVAVTSDGRRLFVSDLGHNRVLIWNSTPTQNGQPADLVIGQPSFTDAVSNYSTKLCASNGTDSSGNATYPDLCAATLNFPRFALSDGQRLYVADGGNDRVLVYNSIPTQNGQPADVVLGQISDTVVQTSDTTDMTNTTGMAWVERRSSADSMRTPTSLAWDGTNLYVTEPYSRRVLVYTPAPIPLPQTAIRNSASLEVYAIGTVTISGTIKEGESVGVQIRDKKYMYTVKKDDTFDTIITNIVQLVNAGTGDPWVIATADFATSSIILTSRVGGEAGNETAISGQSSTNSNIRSNAAGSSLSGGHNAAKLAPGTLISIFADGLADLAPDAVVSAPDTNPLPTSLAGVQVYVDGRLSPILSVTRNQVNAQFPFEVLDSTSANAFVRTMRSNGAVSYTNALGIPIVAANPGIFTYGGTDPRPAVAFHGSSTGSGAIYIEGANPVTTGGDTVSVTIVDRKYSYTVNKGDTLEQIRDNLIAQINAKDQDVYAFPAGQFARIRLRAKAPGPDWYLPIAASGGNNVLMGVLGNGTSLCCGNTEGAPVTADNPAVPGEEIYVLATGLGMVGPDEAKQSVWTGWKYYGPAMNASNVRMDALAGGKTANVFFMGMIQGTVGLYRVDLQLLSGLPTDPTTQVHIAQDVYVSNVVTIPVNNPNPQ